MLKRKRGQTPREKVKKPVLSNIRRGEVLIYKTK
jgi:hypothetical protein